MPDYRAPLREIDFLLGEVFDSGAHYASLSGCEELTPELLTDIVRGAAEFAEQVVAPLLRVGDEQGCQFENGEVRTPDGYAEAFRLYDTYGLPLDFTEELAADRGLTVDGAGFDKELQAQQERARQASKMGAVKGDPVYMKLAEEAGRTTFLGYETLEVDESRVLAVLRDGAPAPRLDAGQEGQIVLDRTPFYAMAGGQVGDHGVLASDGSAAEVRDTTAPLPGLVAHHVRVTHGGFEPGMLVRAEVDPGRRGGAMRHHTGTHLLHAALRETLGPHVKQAGSLVAPDRLRFDFSHYAPVSPREQRHIENRVNAEILKGAGVESKVMDREQALAYGALAFFGDKYGEEVRVVEVPGFSKEFCGGTHVHHTGDIGLFLLTSEQGVSAGTRRIEALAGEAAVERAQADEGILDELELPLVPVLADLEATGVALDRSSLDVLAATFGETIARLQEDIYASVGHEFNLGSPKQLEQVLFYELDLPKGKRTKTGYSTAASVLEDLREAHPMVSMLIREPSNSLCKALSGREIG